MSLLPGATASDVAVEGVRLRVHRAGPSRPRRSTPTLLLHGFPQTSDAWSALLPELARDRDVLAPDLKGLGASEVAPPYDGRTVAAELAALVLHAVDGPVDVVGHDLGGTLAIALAAARPDLVRRLVVVGGGSRRAMLTRGWRTPGRGSPAVLLGYARGIGSNRPALPAQAVERALVLWGAADRLTPIAAGQALARALGPTAVTVTLPGVGHWPLQEAPELAVAAIAGFLRAA
ncbi:MAG: hypothetical protein NVSMB13_10000 [Mycobacteriales bacterium]